VYGLARLGDERYMNRLAEGLASKDGPVRRNAATILGLLGNRSAAGMLFGRLHDRDPVMRLAVAEALARLGDTRGLPVIRTMASGEGGVEVWQQVGAILALGRVGMEGEDIERLQMIETRRQVDSAVRLAAFGARGMLGDYSQMTVLADMASGRDSRWGPKTPPQGRALALQMLARTSYGLAWRDVCGCLDDGNADVRLSAAWAMLAFNNPRADKVIRAITRPESPQMLSEEEVLRPYRKPAQTPTQQGPLGPLGVPGMPGN
jgi:HEAT repeat protein